MVSGKEKGLAIWTNFRLRGQLRVKNELEMITIKKRGKYSTYTKRNIYILKQTYLRSC